MANCNAGVGARSGIWPDGNEAGSWGRVMDDRHDRVPDVKVTMKWNSM